jgi:thymidylate synthase
LAQLIIANTLVSGWREATRALIASPGHEIYDLIVEIADPGRVEVAALAEVDRHLRARRLQSLHTVANTIFPSHLARRSTSRTDLYQRYERDLPRIRHRDQRNLRGTYFSRIIRFPLQNDPARANQLERVIHDLQVRPEARMRHIYEIQVFTPGKDLRPQGFPCLSSVSIHVEEEAVRLAATYRNQYYMERGLGNFIGLADLQRFIASEAGLPVGRMSVHAFHANLDGSARRAEDLIATAPIQGAG